MSLRRLVLLRHGRTEWNASARMQGRLDPELDEVGRAQAERVAPLVAAHRPVVLVASDQRRAWATATAVGGASGLVPRPEPRLRETALGEWEGRTGPEIEAEWPGALAAWRHDATYVPPGGEARIDACARALPAVADLIAELDDGAPDAVGYDADPGATALLVAHGGTINAVTAGLLGWPPPLWPTLQPLRNCRWGVLEHRLGVWRLAAWGSGAE